MYEEIDVISHSCICIRGSKNVYFDPFEMPNEPHDADIVCVTHEHYDHFSPEDLRKVLNDSTVLFFPASMAENKDLQKMRKELALKKIYFLAPGDSMSLRGIVLKAVRAYNVDKSFHPREEDWIGYILDMNDTVYYVAGDTDSHPENLFVTCDVALVPVGGTYTFNADEAAAFIGKIQCKAAIPTHYGTAVGKKEDGGRFVDCVKTKCPNVNAFERMRFALTK